MKYWGIVLVLVIILLPLAAGGKHDEPVPGDLISGRIEGGLRFLPVPAGEEELEFTIYRGDYIVFEGITGGRFSVPDLAIDETLPRPREEKPYVKMKESGDFAFTLGERRGVFHVLEITEANYHELSARELAQILENTDPLIIDVRTPGEYEQAHIAGANLLPVQVLEENIPNLDQSKDEDIVLYCASGNRSTVAARLLLDAGFTKIYNLRYGIGDWIRKGQPVE